MSREPYLTIRICYTGGPRTSTFGVSAITMKIGIRVTNTVAKIPTLPPLVGLRWLVLLSLVTYWEGVAQSTPRVPKP